MPDPARLDKLETKPTVTQYKNRHNPRIREWELTDVFEFWSGSDRHPEMLHYNYLGRSSWKGNLLKPNGNHGRYGHNIYDWLLTDMIRGGFGLTDAPKWPTSSRLD